MMMLRVKHLVATSPLADGAAYLQRAMALPRNAVQPDLALLRDEDRMMQHCFQRLIKRDSNCIDVGAHIGSKTQQICNLAPDGRHHIVEASPTKSRWLKRRFPNLTVHAQAVSDRAGEVTFYENRKKPGFSSLAQREKMGGFEPITVPCSTLDQLIPRSERIDFLKIDVEGFEYEVLKGAAGLIRRCRPAFVFEAGAHVADSADGDKYHALFDLIDEEFGYDIYPTFHFHMDLDPISKASFVSYRTYPFLAFNFVAVPKAAS